MPWTILNSFAASPVLTRRCFASCAVTGFVSSANILNRLIVDFNRLHKLAMLVLSQSSEDQSALFSELMSLRFHFWVAIMRVEISYVVCRLGTRPVVVTDVLRQLEAMSCQLALLPQAKLLLSN